MKRNKLFATLIKAYRHKKFKSILLFLIKYLAVLTGTLLVVFVADNLMNFDSQLRVFILGAFVLTNLWALLYLLLKTGRTRFHDREIAIELEAQNDIKDNSLVNALCFIDDDAISDDLKGIFMTQAESSCKTVKINKIWQDKRWSRLLKVTVLVIVGIALYCLLFTNHAQNALQRFVDPYSELNSLNFTQFSISPGDTAVIEGENCKISAKATLGGEPVSQLSIIVKSSDESILYKMSPEANSHHFTLKTVSTPLQYRVANQQDQSRWFSVRVTRKPSFKSLQVTIVPPQYTGQPEWVLPNLRRQADILKGSSVKLTAATAPGSVITCRKNNRPVPLEQDTRFEISDKVKLSLSITDKNKLSNRNAWSCEFSPLEDRKPEVRFLNHQLNKEALLNTTVPLYLSANDDYGIKELKLYAMIKKQKTALKTFTYLKPVSKRREFYALKILPSLFSPNQSYRIFAEVVDNSPRQQRAVTVTPFTIHVTDPKKGLLEKDSSDPLSELYAMLFKVIGQQKIIRDQLASEVDRFRRHQQNQLLHNQNNNVHRLLTQAANLAENLEKKGLLKKHYLAKLVAIRDGISSQVSQTIMGLRKIKWTPENVKIQLNEIVKKQTQLMVEIERLLGAFGLDKKQKELAQQKKEEEESEKEFFDKLKNLKDGIEKFQDDQRKIIAKTEAIDKKDPDDWSDEEEKLLGELAAKEDDFAKFFKVALNDLSKLQQQDFSNSVMANELVEMYEELQKAGEALKKKNNIEIATLAEEGALSSSENVEQNLERWLADKQDSIKWNMEESGDTKDTQLTDLPDELTDIIGDLIESEDDMSEDNEDSTNSAVADSDEGLGWGVSDGNIDSMQAKGITGNVLPNNNEVGGRSGEGRSGKSSGQFVEQEATGKGGRDTPTRLTDSPFEKGTVKDSSTDPQGGATGGGKQSGTGGEGLRGRTPDQDPNLSQRLPAKFAEMKQKAEALQRKLAVNNLPTGDLEKAIAQMEQINKRPSGQSGMNIKQVRNDLLATLKDARTAVNQVIKTDQETRQKQQRNNIITRHHQQEKTPNGYEDAVEQYFKALSGEENK